MKTIAAALVFALAALAVGGCATVVRSVPADFRPSADGGTVVIGRIEVIRSDTGEGLWKDISTPALQFLRGDRLQVRAEHERTGRKYVIGAVDLGPTSDFYVVLPHGRYQIDEISTSALKLPVKATFDVPAVPGAYIGTLRFPGTVRPSVSDCCWWRRGAVGPSRTPRRPWSNGFVSTTRD